MENQIQMQRLTVRIRFLEDVLGTSPNNKQLHQDYVAGKAPDARLIEEEIEDLGAEEVTEKSMTVFPRNADGEPFIYDYQIKGFLKDSCKMLKKVSGTHCSTIKAYKSEIDGLVFVSPRKIALEMPEGAEVGRCERPLRASTPMGERIALADSESCPAGTECTVTFECLTPSMMKMVKEILPYGKLRGIGQWRNSGAGRFVYEVIE